MYSNLHRVGIPINGVEPSGQVDFFTNITQFWHGTVATIEMLHLEPQYRVLLQPCTMCEYPYRMPFYIVLIVLVSFNSFLTKTSSKELFFGLKIYYYS